VVIVSANLKLSGLADCALAAVGNIKIIVATRITTQQLK
jgi:hypothetical protein